MPPSARRLGAAGVARQRQEGRDEYVTGLFRRAVAGIVLEMRLLDASRRETSLAHRAVLAMMMGEYIGNAIFDSYKGASELQ